MKTASLLVFVALAAALASSRAGADENAASLRVMREGSVLTTSDQVAVDGTTGKVTNILQFTANHPMSLLTLTPSGGGPSVRLGTFDPALIASLAVDRSGVAGLILSGARFELGALKAASFATNAESGLRELQVAAIFHTLAANTYTNLMVKDFGETLTFFETDAMKSLRLAGHRLDLCLQVVPLQKTLGHMPVANKNDGSTAGACVGTPTPAGYVMNMVSIGTNWKGDSKVSEIMSLNKIAGAPVGVNAGVQVERQETGPAVKSTHTYTVGVMGVY